MVVPRIWSLHSCSPPDCGLWNMTKGANCSHCIDGLVAASLPEASRNPSSISASTATRTKTLLIATSASDTSFLDADTFIRHCHYLRDLMMGPPISRCDKFEEVVSSQL